MGHEAFFVGKHLHEGTAETNTNLLFGYWNGGQKCTRAMFMVGQSLELRHSFLVWISVLRVV